MKSEKNMSGRQTLTIIEQGYYTVTNQKINISDQIKNSVDKTALYSPQSFGEVMQQAKKEIENRNFDTQISVEKGTSMEAAEKWVGEGKTACLNFASAKNPGGGFLGNARAQEESLARASALYPTLTKYFTEMYEYNRKQSTYLYSDYMIYSPEVPFFKNDKGELLEKPYLLDILTSPAVNIGAMKQNKPEEIVQAESVMMDRIDKMFSVFVQQGAENLILGAWGCGVFQNKPEEVARYFAHYLLKEGKYANYFKNIVFAVYDRSKNGENIAAFEKVFS